MKLLKFLVVLLCLFAAPAAASAADVGVYVRPISSISSPVDSKTFAFDTGDRRLKVWRSSAWETITLPKIQYAGVGAPGASTDSTLDYAPGALYFHASAKEWYVCADNAVGAAVWHQITSRYGATENALKLSTADVATDWLVSGLLGSDPGASLAMTTPSGVGYVGGSRLSAGPFSNTYTASKDTYEYLQADATMLRVAVDNGASAPSGQPGLQIQKVVTDGTEITGVTQIAPLLPIVSVLTATSANHAVNLALGDARYAPIYAYSSQAQRLIYASPENSTGLPTFQSITNNYLPVVDPAHGGTGSNITVNNLGFLYGNGSNFVQMSVPPSGDYGPKINSAGTAWEWGAFGSGSVSTVSMTAPSNLFDPVSITNPSTTPAIALALKTGLTANRVVATPDGSTGAVDVRALVNNDLPIVSAAKGGTGANLTMTDACILITNGSTAAVSPAAGALQSWRRNAANNGVEAYTPAGSSTKVAVKTADETVNNSATIQDDDHLFLSVGASETWAFDAVIYHTHGANAGNMDITFTGPSGCSLEWGYSDFKAGNSGLISGSGVEAPLSTDTSITYPTHISGYITTAGTAGNLQFGWAQIAADSSDCTVKKGSTLKMINKP